jgi:hypothetical protein
VFLEVAPCWIRRWAEGCWCCHHGQDEEGRYHD